MTAPIVRGQKRIRGTRRRRKGRRQGRRRTVTRRAKGPEPWWRMLRV